MFLKSIEQKTVKSIFKLMLSLSLYTIWHLQIFCSWEVTSYKTTQSLQVKVNTPSAIGFHVTFSILWFCLGTATTGFKLDNSLRLSSSGNNQTFTYRSKIYEQWYIYINFYLLSKDINNTWECVLIEIFIPGVKCVICL